MQTKICSGKYGCGKELPITEFYYTNKERGWRHSHCKKCHKRYVALRMKLNPNLRYNKKVKESLDRYRKTPEGRIAHNKASRRSYRKYREKWTSSDSYVKQLLSQMNIIETTHELIEAKRNQLKLYRHAKRTNYQQTE